MDCRVPHRVDNVVEKDVDGELIVVNANTNELVGLSESGRAIWELIDGRRTVDDIVSRMCADYGIRADAPVENDDPAPDNGGQALYADRGSVGEEVRSFVGRLAEKGLVEIP